MDRAELVLLPPPELGKWRAMKEVQKALWMIDEVEARWQSFLRQYPEMERIEVFWGRGFEGSIEAAVEKVAQALRLPAPPKQAVKRTQVHSGTLSESASRDMNLYQLDREYREMMGYNYLPG